MSTLDTMCDQMKNIIEESKTKALLRKEINELSDDLIKMHEQFYELLKLYKSYEISKCDEIMNIRERMLDILASKIHIHQPVCKEKTQFNPRYTIFLTRWNEAPAGMFNDLLFRNIDNIKHYFKDVTIFDLCTKKFTKNSKEKLLNEIFEQRMGLKLSIEKSRDMLSEHVAISVIW